MADQSAFASLQEALGAAWDRAKGLTAKDIQSGLDAASLATVAWPLVGDAVGLGADAYRYITQPEERTGANYAMSALGALPFVPSASAVHAAGAAVPAAVGMLRKGGDESLMPWHQTNGHKLLNALSAGRAKGELTSPSIGISKDWIPAEFFGTGGDAMLIPRIGAFDPGAYTSSLFNRDAYTPRAGDYAWTSGNLNEGAARLRDKALSGEGFAGKNLKGREEGNLDVDLDGPDFGPNPAGYELLTQKVGGLQHALGILDSPSFRNFREFERSPKGAGLLTSGYTADAQTYRNHANAALEKVFPEIASKERLLDALDEWLILNDRTKGGNREVMEYLTKNSPRQVKEVYPNLGQLLAESPQLVPRLDKLRGALARSPSNYAELKVHGGAQINPEHWAGAILGMGTTAEEALRMRLADALEARGIPTAIVGTRNNYNPKHAFELADMFQRDAGPARKSPL